MGFVRPENTKVKKADNNDVIFNEEYHKYYYKGQPLISTTQFISLFYKEFNSLYSSISKSKKNIKEKTGIKDSVKLRKYWRLNGERKSSIGTAAHIFAEMYEIDNNTKPVTKYEEAVIKALKKIKEEWLIISQEELLYSTEFMIAGTADLILQNIKTKEYWIGDWKTTADLYKGYGNLYSPFDIKNIPLNKYSIQLDIYSILSKYYIREVNRLVIKLNDDGTYNFYYPENNNKEYELPYTIEKTKKALNTYKKENKIKI